MGATLNRVKLMVFNALSEDGRQGKLNIITEYVISAAICLNVVLIVFESIGINGRFGYALGILRIFFFVFFLTEYVLRLWIADLTAKTAKGPVWSRVRYMFTFDAVINLLALLPVMLGSTFIDFRIFRILRLLRIIQLKSLRRYTDTLQKVFLMKGAQLVASLFIVFIFMLTSAVIIYDFENKAQPDVFNNILSCLWWSISAVTTIGYGDMFPITPVGKIFASLISIFGVFLMAVPIGILTSGFFELSKTGSKDKNVDD